MTEPKQCSRCGGKLIRRKIRKFPQRVQCQCVKCHRYFTYPYTPRHPRTAKILLLDIETLYLEADGLWSLKPDYIQPECITKDWSIVCWAAKWLFEPEIIGEVVKPKEAIARNEESILGGIWKLMDEADILIGQNSNNFDIRRLNAKFLKYGYPPPSPYKSIDLLPVARSRFHLTSYKLDVIATEVLGIRGKKKMTIDDWRACSRGEQDALDNMLDYCKRDVAPLLEDWYLRLLPWIPNHPNLGIYTDHDKDVCPKCESTELKWTTQYATPQGLFDGFRCGACGAIGRGTSKLHRVKTVSIKPT